MPPLFFYLMTLATFGVIYGVLVIGLNIHWGYAGILDFMYIAFVAVGGYVTALLAHRAAHVHSVELKPALAAFGRHNLERHGTANVTLEIGDAARGWERHAPYHVIVLTGSTPVLPRAFLQQLEMGGLVLCIGGGADGMVSVCGKVHGCACRWVWPRMGVGTRCRKSAK